MPIETMGSAEVLLKLLATYQGFNGSKPRREQVWHYIAAYMNKDGRYHFYDPPSDRGPSFSDSEPPAKFLGDLKRLEQAGFIVISGDGRVDVTPAGRGLASIKQVPSGLSPLEKEFRKGGHHARLGIHRSVGY